MDLTTKIKILLIKMGRSQKDLYSALDLKRNTWMSKMKNPGTIKYSEIQKICEFFSVTVEKLMKGVE